MPFDAEPELQFAKPYTAPPAYQVGSAAHYRAEADAVERDTAHAVRSPAHHAETVRYLRARAAHLDVGCRGTFERFRAESGL